MITALLLALLAAPASPPPAWWTEAMVQFGSACVERSLPANAVEIAREDLPGVLRGHYRRASSAQYHRLGGDTPSYLIRVTNPSRRMSSACAVAVPNRRRLAMLFSGAMQFEPRATAVFGTGYNLAATIVGDWVVVEISHHAASRA